MRNSNPFDDLAKSAAGGMTRRAAVIRVAQTFGGLLLGAFGLRQSPAQDDDKPAKASTLVETLRDSTFKCVSRKGPTLVEGGYDVCLDHVECLSTLGAPNREFIPMCKAKGGKCPRFEVCGDSALQKDNRVGHKEAQLAEVGPDDRRLTDKYGRTCRYILAAPKSIHFMKAKEVISFCATPIECAGGDADAPDLAFAACEPTEAIKEEGKTIPLFVCPRVNHCINTPIKSSKAELIEAEK